MVPDKLVIPIDHPSAAAAPEVTKTEVADRFVEVQPPRQWSRLSPEKHRQTPAAGPGGDVVKILREKERLDAGTEEEEEVAPMQAWAEVPKWKQMLREHGMTGDIWISDRSH